MLSLVHPPSDVGVISGAPETPGCASHAKRWVLAATVLGSSVAFIEASVINVALPAIQEGLGASVGEMQWIASVYTLILAALTLAGGSAGDRFGRLRLFALGLGVVTLASVAAGLAASAAQLIVARAAQGLGAALLVPNSLALLSAAFPRSERGRAIGTWSAFTALTGAGGPIVGGALVDAVSWRAAFLAVVPLALVTLAIALRRVPDVRIGRRVARVDWPGAVLATAGLSVLVYGIITLSSGIPGRVALGVGVVLLAAFALVEARAAAPMVPPRLFRSRTFVGVNLLTLFLYFALGGAFFVLPFNLVRVQGYSAMATGAAYLPFALVLGLLSRWSGGLVDRFGARRPLVIGPAVTAVGLLLLAVPSVGGSYWTTFFLPMVVIGLGMAVTVAPLTSTVMAAVDESDTGVASGVNNTAARAATLLSVAVVGLLAVGLFGRAFLERLPGLGLSPAVHAAVAAERPNLGEVHVPVEATMGERDAIAAAVGAALVSSFRWIATLAAVLAASAALVAAATISPVPVRGAAGAGLDACGHVELLRDVDLPPPGCEDCLRLGERWVHLRQCLSCGYVGCCDSSRGRHATAHFWASNHPIVRSLEPGESWRWCYVDELAV